MENLKILSLFSGIGAFEKALTRLDIPFELLGYSEIDKYASKSYSLIHNVSEDLNLGDITKIDETNLPDIDLVTYSFPCTDISICGKQKGLYDENGNKTRSGLLFDALRIIKYKKPKYAIAENVKNLVSKKFKGDFDNYLAELDSYGYNSYWSVLNSKHFNIPQNRERVFIVSIRKDIDDGKFEFPIGCDSGVRLKDILEDNVDEKYYISQDKTDKLLEQLKNKNIHNDNDITYKKDMWGNIIKVGNVNPSGNGLNGNVYSEEGLCPTLTTNKGEGNKILQIGKLDIKGNDQIKRVYDTDGLSPTLSTMQGGNRQPKIIISNDLKFIGGIDTSKKWIDNDAELSRNYSQGNRVYDSEGIACSQTAQGGGIGSYTGLYLENLNYRIRKLTPLECYRLMDFDDKDYYILKQNQISDTQIYKTAGNSIVVGVLEAILKKIFKTNT